MDFLTILSPPFFKTSYQILKVMRNIFTLVHHLTELLPMCLKLNLPFAEESYNISHCWDTISYYTAVQWRRKKITITTSEIISDCSQTSSS